MVYPLRSQWLRLVISGVLFGVGIGLSGNDLEASSDDRTPNVSRVGVVLGQEPAEKAIIDSLCRMQLFESAISRCRTGIESAEAGSLSHARWTALLISATTSRDAENAEWIREALDESKQIYERYIASSKNLSFQAWVAYSYEEDRYQLANRSVANFLSAPTNTLRREDALETLRSILDHLAQIKEDIQVPLGASLRNDDREAAQTVRDLTSLRNRLSLLEIDCMLLRCDCYPPNSDERIAGGTEALVAIEKVTERLESDWSGQELLELARIQSLMALGRYADAIKYLDQWIPSVKDPMSRYRAIAMSARANQLLGDLKAANQSLLAAPGDALESIPEMALAALDLQIETWKRRAEKGSEALLSTDQNDREIEAILRSKDRIADRFGDYWKNRSEALVVAASLGKAASDRSSTSSTSLDLLKVSIRQRIAAKDFPGAIVLLDQAEAAAMDTNDPIQAFALAKAAVGLLQQPAAGSTSSMLSHELMLVDRMALAAKKYASLDTSSLLHHSAIARLRPLLQNASTASDALGQRYKQLLLQHVESWPNAATSAEALQQLQRICLGALNLEELIGLWEDELSRLSSAQIKLGEERLDELGPRMEIAEISLANALLLSTFLRSSDAQLRTPANSESKNLSPLSRWTLEALNGDYDWWMIDGGVRRADGATLTWSSSSNDADGQSVQVTFRRLLLAAKQADSEILEEDVRRLIDWLHQDFLGRFAWFATLESSLSNILRLRTISTPHNRDLLRWSNVLTRIRDAWRSELASYKEAFAPSLYSKLNKWSSVCEAWAAVFHGDVEAGIQIIEALSKADQRNPRWILELARIYEMQGGNGIEKALQSYRTLAAGSPVGSDLWFESRLSSARCLRTLDKPSEADEILALVRAMVAEVPTKWQRRIK